MGRLRVFEAGWCWRVWCSFWSTLSWMQPMVVVTERILCHVPVHGGFLEVLVIPVCAVRTWNSGALFLLLRLCIWQSLLVRLGVAYGTEYSHWIFRRLIQQWLHVLRQSCLFWTNYTLFLRQRGLRLQRFSPFSCRMEKYAQSMLRFESLHALFALEVWTTFLRVDVLEPAW